MEKIDLPKGHFYPHPPSQCFLVIYLQCTSLVHHPLSPVLLSLGVNGGEEKGEGRGWKLEKEKKKNVKNSAWWHWLCFVPGASKGWHPTAYSHPSCLSASKNVGNTMYRFPLKHEWVNMHGGYLFPCLSAPYVDYLTVILIICSCIIQVQTYWISWVKMVGDSEK